MEYIIRFKQGNEIKTLKVNDIETYNYIINKLDQEEKEYIVIKKHNSILYHNEFTLKSLLDYEAK